MTHRIGTQGAQTRIAGSFWGDGTEEGEETCDILQFYNKEQNVDCLAMCMLFWHV